MARIFSYDSKFSYIVFRIAYGCYLNALWLVCSLPIFTIGASTTALYYACLKIIRGEESYPARMFFRAFRENFRQATRIWLILLGVGLFLGADGYILFHLRASAQGPAAVFWTLLLAIVIAAGVMYVIVLLFVFPLLASVSNTDRAMLKNSFLIGTHYLFATILVFAIHFAMFFVVVAWFTPLIVFGEGLCALVSAWLLNSILISVSGTPEDEEQEALPEAEAAAEPEALPKAEKDAAEQEALPETAEDTKPETEEEQP